MDIKNIIENEQVKAFDGGVKKFIAIFISILLPLGGKTQITVAELIDMLQKIRDEI